MVTFGAAAGAAVTAVWLGGVVKGLVDAVKKVVPALDEDKEIWGIAHLPARALAVALAAAGVIAYHVNLPAASGLASASPVVDAVVTVVAVALSAMGVNDGLNLWAPLAAKPAPAPTPKEG